MGHSGNIHHGLETNDNKSLVLLLHQSNIHHSPQYSNKESLVLMNHYNNIHYKRRSNGFTTIVLQGLRIQEQSLISKVLWAFQWKIAQKPPLLVLHQQKDYKFQRWLKLFFSPYPHKCFLIQVLIHENQSALWLVTEEIVFHIWVESMSANFWIHRTQSR
jgi:hypothetical protein